MIDSLPQRGQAHMGLTLCEGSTSYNTALRNWDNKGLRNQKRSDYLNRNNNKNLHIQNIELSGKPKERHLHPLKSQILLHSKGFSLIK